MKKRPPTFDECFYHEPCADGISSAWVVSKFTKCSKFTGLAAGRDPIYTDEVLFPEGKSLIYVDLCPSASHLLELIRHNNTVLIIDHHTSAIEIISKYKEFIGLTLYLKTERSGCGLTWDYFKSHDDEEFPWLLKYIEDRDLWKFKYDETKAVMSSFFEYYPGCSIQNIDSILKTNPNGVPLEWISNGLLSLQKREIEIETYRKKAVFCGMSGTPYVVKTVDCPRELRSDVGNAIAQEADFAVLWTYDEKKNEWWISLRGSDKCEIDLSNLAMNYGGGGHPKASGFTIEGNETEKNKTYPRSFDKLFIDLEIVGCIGK
jgi:oligoribonuclease NrnB/cAMP/cGMP phosphodiesterase (DHH superfamily)